MSVRWLLCRIIILAIAAKSAARAESPDCQQSGRLKVVAASLHDRADADILREIGELKRAALDREAAKASAKGVALDFEPRCYSDERCLLLEAAQRVAPDHGGPTGFSAALDRVAPLYSAYCSAASASQEPLAGGISDFGYGIYLMVGPGQILRSVFVHGPKSGFLGLSEPDLRLFQRLIGLEIGRRDQAGVEKLEASTTESGWSAVGDMPSAWKAAVLMIVQHADADPIFQQQGLTALRALALQGKFPERWIAPLYDRVELASKRPQLYGTQFECKAGKYVPSRMMLPESVDVRRVAIGLPTLADYAKMLPSSC